MAFHADFWVVAGTAAPVIALASVVAARECLTAIQPLNDARRLTLRLPDDKVTSRRLRAAWWALAASLTLAYFNMLAQAVVLAASLASLSNDKAEFAPKAAGAIVTLGVITQLQAIRQQVAAQTPRGRPVAQPLARAIQQLPIRVGAVRRWR